MSSRSSSEAGFSTFTFAGGSSAPAAKAAKAAAHDPREPVREARPFL